MIDRKTIVVLIFYFFLYFDNEIVNNPGNNVILKHNPYRIRREFQLPFKRIRFVEPTIFKRIKI